jgi:heme-degrading monooxygenase HmoA
MHATYVGWYVLPVFDQAGEGVLMAILMILEWQDVTTEDYERVNETIGIHGDADAPEGLIEHVAALTDDDELVIVDLWESDEALGRFFETRLAPAIQQLGLPESQPRMAHVHNHQPGTASEGNTLILIEVEDATTDDYDAMASSMPAHAKDGPGHPGHIHIAASDGSSLLVADLWPSPEAFGQFAQEQVGPAAQKAGVTSMNQRTLRVHNRIRGRSTVSS